jgi:hypothetical protein
LNEPRSLDPSQIDIDFLREIDAVCWRFEADWRSAAVRLLDDDLAIAPDAARTMSSR